KGFVGADLGDFVFSNRLELSPGRRDSTRYSGGLFGTSDTGVENNADLAADIARLDRFRTNRHDPGRACGIDRRRCAGFPILVSSGGWLLHTHWDAAERPPPGGANYAMDSGNLLVFGTQRESA